MDIDARLAWALICFLIWRSTTKSADVARHYRVGQSSILIRIIVRPLSSPKGCMR